MWILNSLCFLTLSVDCEDLHGRKLLLYVRIVCRNDCCSAFLCITALVKQCLLEVLGTDRVIAHVKTCLCSETATAEISFWAKRGRLVCWRDPFLYFFAQNKWLNWEFIYEMFFSVKYKRSCSLNFWASRTVVCWRVWNGNCMIRVLKGCYCHQASDVFWRIKRQVTSIGQIFPWFQSCDLGLRCIAFCFTLSALRNWKNTFLHGGSFAWLLNYRQHQIAGVQTSCRSVRVQF